MSAFLSLRHLAGTVAGVGLFLIPCGSLLADWPNWRGPTGDNVAPEAGVPLRWTATENVRWRVPLPQRGNSSPIVWGERVFVTQAIEKENKRLVLCFDRADGKLLWQSGPIYTGPEDVFDQNPPGAPSPVTDGERVIAWFGSAGVYCYDFEGKEIWKRDLGRQSHEWGYAASPVIYKDLCILHFGPGEPSFLIALDKRTGETVWRTDVSFEVGRRTDGFASSSGGGIVASFSTPMVIQAGGRDELVLSFPVTVRSYNPSTGAELWRCEGINPLVYTSPMYAEGILVAMGGFQGTAVAVKPGGSGDVTGTHKLWETPRVRNRIGTGVIKGGHIYILNSMGIGECIELRTGKLVWEERFRGTGATSESWSSMVLVGDRIYVSNQSGETFVVRASPDFEVLAVNSVGELTNSTLAISRGEIFLRTHQALWCIAEMPAEGAR